MEFLKKILLLWVNFALMDPDPDSEYGSESGSTDLIESGSNTDPDPKPCRKWNKSSACYLTTILLRSLVTETNNSRSKAQTVSGRPSASATAAGGATRLNQNNGLAAAAQQRTISNANNSHTGSSKKKTARSRSELERLQESPGIELEWVGYLMICRLRLFKKDSFKILSKN
jgi:hypothetical protein